MYNNLGEVHCLVLGCECALLMHGTQLRVRSTVGSFATDFSKQVIRTEDDGQL